VNVNTLVKDCLVCGRVITWRKSLAATWEQVKYCSSACRTHKPNDDDVALEACLLQMLDAARGRSVDVAGAEASMPHIAYARERVRRAARRLVSRGMIEVVDNGRVVDPSRARGPMHVRLVPANGARK
jgi:hypothetical protein